MARRRLGEILLEAGALSEAQLAQALAQQQKVGGRLGGVLVAAGFVSESQVVMCLSQQLGLPAARFPATVPQAVLDAIPVAVCEKHGVFPLSSLRDPKGEILTVAMVDPTNIEVIDAIQFRSGRRVIPAIAGETETMAAIRRHYYGEAPRTEVNPQGDAQFAGHEVDLSDSPDDDIPVVTGTLSQAAAPQPTARAATAPAAPTTAAAPPVAAPTIAAPTTAGPTIAPTIAAPPPAAPPIAASTIAASTIAPTIAASPPSSMFGAAGGFLGAEDDEPAKATPVASAETEPPSLEVLVEPAKPDELMVEVVAEPSGPIPVSPAAAVAGAAASPTATTDAPVEEILELDSSAIILDQEQPPARTRTTVGPPPPPAAPPPAVQPTAVQPATTTAAPAPTVAPPAAPTPTRDEGAEKPPSLVNAAFCPQCGATRVAGSKFCPMCGCSFTGAERASTAPRLAAASTPPTPTQAAPVAPAPSAPSAPPPAVPAPKAPQRALSIGDIEALEGVRGSAFDARSSPASAFDEVAALRGDATNGVGLATTHLAFIRSAASTPDDADVLAGAARAWPTHLVPARADERSSAWGAVDDVAVLLASAPPPLLEVVPLASPAALARDWRDVAERPIPRKDNRTDVAIVPRSRETFMPSPDDEMPPPTAPSPEPQLAYTPATAPGPTSAPAPWAAFAPLAGASPAAPTSESASPLDADKKPGG